jgi:hypothetical protein
MGRFGRKLVIRTPIEEARHVAPSTEAEGELSQGHGDHISEGRPNLARALLERNRGADVEPIDGGQPRSGKVDGGSGDKLTKAPVVR